MATCEPASILDWRASRRWVVRVVLLILLIMAVGTIFSSGWLVRLAWLAGGVAALRLVWSVNDRSYRRFLMATDRAWITSLAAADDDVDLALVEMEERLYSPWSPARRSVVSAAIPASLAWIGRHASARPADHWRDLIVVLCRVVRKTAPPDAEDLLRALRNALLTIDHGRIDAWGWQEEC